MDCEVSSGEPRTAEDFNQDELSRLRQELRDSMMKHREMRRQHVLRRSRFLRQSDERLDLIAIDEFKKLVKQFLSKKTASHLLLCYINNALLEGDEYISAFFSIEGSLQALVRGLSGQDERLQLASAECVINLSLGDKQLSWKLLEACHPYLYAHLSGMNNYVKEDCLAAVGNLSRHGHKHIAFLLSQDFFPQIINILNGNDETLHNSAIYAMVQIVFFGFDMLSSEHFNSALEACVPIYREKCFSVAFLMSLLSAEKDCHDNLYFYKVHIDSLKNLLIALKDDDKQALYYLRIVTNCVAARSSRMADDLMGRYPKTLADCVLLASESEHLYLREENLSLTANILNHPANYDYFAGVFFKENFIRNVDLLLAQKRMISSHEVWKGVLEFAENVLLVKEQSERERERKHCK